MKKLITALLILFLFSPVFARQRLQQSGKDSYTALLLNFTKGSGTTAFDISENGNDGTIVGAIWVDGMHGICLEFDGSDRIDVSDDATLDITSAITIESWAKLETRATYSTIVSKYSPSHTYWLELTSDDNYVRTLLGGPGGLDDDTTLLALNTWYLFGVTYDGSHIRLYVNGVNVKSVEGSGAIDTNDATIHIGRGFASDTWGGKIASVKILNRAKSPAEMKMNYEIQRRFFQ